LWMFVIFISFFYLDCFSESGGGRKSLDCQPLPISTTMSAFESVSLCLYFNCYPDVLNDERTQVRERPPWIYFRPTKLDGREELADGEVWSWCKHLHYEM
jgi:hypothetical protein